jgi:hypothetical protein
MFLIKRCKWKDPRVSDPNSFEETGFGSTENWTTTRSTLPTTLNSRNVETQWDIILPNTELLNSIPQTPLLIHVTNNPIHIIQIQHLIWKKKLKINYKTSIPMVSRELLLLKFQSFQLSLCIVMVSKNSN